VWKVGRAQIFPLFCSFSAPPVFFFWVFFFFFFFFFFFLGCFSGVGSLSFFEGGDVGGAAVGVWWGYFVP